MTSSDLPFENHKPDAGLFEQPTQHNPGLHELEGSGQGVSRLRMIGATTMAGLALVSVVKAGSGNHADAGSEFSAPEAGGSVLNTVPEIVPVESGLPEQSLDQFNAHYDAIGRMRPVYEEIEANTGVPWMYMAALHYREGSNRPDGSMFAGEKIGTTNPDHGDVKGTDIVSNGIRAAEHFKRNARSVYGVEVRPDMPDNELAYAFLAFNRGSMYRNAEEHIGHEMTPDESPYVMNGIDANRVGMRWPNVGHYGSGTDWGEPYSVQGKRNNPLGALTIVHGINERLYGAEVPTQPEIVIIGDSLSVGDNEFAKIQDADALFKKEIIHYDAAGSRSLKGKNNGLEAIWSAAPQIQRADSLVIALGTNMPESEAEYEQLLRDGITVAKTANPQVKVFIPEIIGFEEGSKNAVRKQARNDIIRKLEAEGLVSFIPLDISGEFAPDNVHLTPEGYKKRATQILDTV